MTNMQRQEMLLKYDHESSYWAKRTGMEPQQQYKHCQEMIKYLVTRLDTCKARVQQNGPNLVFPCL